MLVIIVGLFNALRPAAIIMLTIPFAVVGMTAGLLATGTPFGFVALLGAMSLAGMMVKNAIVLLDEVNANLSAGRAPTTCRRRCGPVAPTASLPGHHRFGRDPFAAGCVLGRAGGDHHGRPDDRHGIHHDRRPGALRHLLPRLGEPVTAARGARARIGSAGGLGLRAWRPRRVMG